MLQKANLSYNITSLDFTFENVNHYYTIEKSSNKHFTDDEASASSEEFQSIYDFALVQEVLVRHDNPKAFFTATKNPVGNNTTENASLYYYLCRHPGFCKGDFYKNCIYSSIHLCEECKMGLAAVFLLCILCLGLAITLGNIVIIMVSWARKKEKKANKMDVWKSSLAVADMIAG